MNIVNWRFTRESKSLQILIYTWHMTDQINGTIKLKNGKIKDG